jgi:hypothetical protein
VQSSIDRPLIGRAAVVLLGGDAEREKRVFRVKSN